MEPDPSALRDDPAVDPVALADLPVPADRRRPGRLAIRNPHLVALMRVGREASSRADAPEAEAGDDLAAARGIALAAVLGALLWVAVLGLFRLLRRRVGL